MYKNKKKQEFRIEIREKEIRNYIHNHKRWPTIEEDADSQPK